MGAPAGAYEPDETPHADPFSDTAGAVARAGDDAVARGRAEGADAAHAAEPRPTAYSSDLEVRLAEQAQRHLLADREANHESYDDYRRRADRRHKHVTLLIILSLWIGFVASTIVLVYACWLFVSGSAHGQLVGGVLIGGGGVAGGSMLPRMARYVRTVRGRRDKQRDGSDQT